MNKEQTIEAIKIMQAYVDGKQIQHVNHTHTNSWYDVNYPPWDWLYANYRIKEQTPFNLELFKQGHKAITKDGKIATFVGICEECDLNFKLIVHLANDTYVKPYHITGQFDFTATNPHPLDLLYMI